MTQQADIRQIGKYRIIEEIGRGGMAVVYKGYDADLQRLVAIKVLPEVYAHDPQFIQRFQHEAIMAARLHHPNIVTIHDVGQQENLYYIVMQYLPGATLDQVVAHNGPLPLETAVAIALQVAAALEDAHHHGIIHRDVKPSNIMISPEGHVTLMDFGLVRAGEASGITRAGTILGTPEYMSPEQAQGQTIDLRTDIYSLGIVLYKMLSGNSPFARSTPYATLLAHINETLVFNGPLARLPREFKRVLHKALAKSPGDRYQSAGVFAADLAKATGVQPGQPVSVRLPATPLHAQAAQEKSPPSALPTRLIAAEPAASLAGAAQGMSEPAAAPAGPQVSASGRKPIPGARGSTAQGMHRRNLAVSLIIMAFVLVIGVVGFILIRARGGEQHDVFTPTAVVGIANLNPTAEAAVSEATALITATVTLPPLPESSEAPVATATLALPAPAITEVPDSPTPLVVTVQVEKVVVVTATPAPTSTPKPATATPLPAPMPSPGLPAPVLLSPNNGADVRGKTMFAWNWSGPTLAANQGFEVRIWREGQGDHYGAAAPVGTTSVEIDVNRAYGVMQGGAGSYLWTVALVQLEPYQRVGLEAEPRALQIQPATGGGKSPSGPQCPPGGC